LTNDIDAAIDIDNRATIAIAKYFRFCICIFLFLHFLNTLTIESVCDNVVR
jgi:hypothetical protein